MDSPPIRVPPQAIELAMRFERFHRVRQGYPTIGYSHRCDPNHLLVMGVECEVQFSIAASDHSSPG